MKGTRSQRQHECGKGGVLWSRYGDHRSKIWPEREPGGSRFGLDGTQPHDICRRGGGREVLLLLYVP